MMPFRRIAAGLAVAALAFALAACGDSSGGSGSDDQAAAGGGDVLSITAPADGAKVDVPFTLQLSSAEPLGPPDTGDHHVHVFYDGDDSKYEVVTSDSFQVTDLPAGEHTITASLRNADHSPAGTDVTIHVTVTSSGGSGSTGGDRYGGNKYGNGGDDSGEDSGDDSGDDSGGGNYGY